MKTVSVIGGKVTRAEHNSTVGHLIKMSGRDSVKTRYLHLSKIPVKKGTPVPRGTVIALSGNNGRLSDPRLHYELVTDNNLVNLLASGAAGFVDNNKLEQHVYTHVRDYGRHLD